MKPWQVCVNYHIISWPGFFSGFPLVSIYNLFWINKWLAVCINWIISFINITLFYKYYTVIGPFIGIDGMVPCSFPESNLVYCLQCDHTLFATAFCQSSLFIYKFIVPQKCYQGRCSQKLGIWLWRDHFVWWHEGCHLSLHSLVHSRHKHT